MRLFRNAAFVHSSRSYCSLSRTFCSALSLGGAAKATSAAIITTAARQPGSNFGIIVLSLWVDLMETISIRYQYGLAEMRHHQSTIVKPPLTLKTWPVM
jgi:hypothetical protein